MTAPLAMCGAVLLWAASLWAAPAPGERPSVFLADANVPRAKALALDAALVKGWRVVESAREHVIFQTLLDTPASMGPPNAVPPERTTLRIRADFVQTPAGVNAYLYAEEIWYAGSSKEWVNDVTPEYRDNLSNALASLKQQWTRIAPRPAGAGGGTGTGGARAADPKVRVSPLGSAAATTRQPPRPRTSAAPPRPPAPPAAPKPRVVDIEVGTWAYHAEQYARSQGCELDELGAELVSGDSAGELHRVHCRSGGSVLVRCDRERCTGGR